MLTLLLTSGILMLGCKTKKQDDWTIEYYPSGAVKSKYRCDKDSMKDGKFWEYYENGIVKEDLNYSMGYLFGEQKFYFEDGTLRKYSVVDGFDDVIYVKKWDKTKRVISEEGVAISPNLYCDKYSNGSIKQYDTIYFETMISLPPPVMSYSVNKWFIREEMAPIKSEKLKAGEHNTITFAEVFSDTGLYRLYIACTLIDSSGAFFLCDTNFKKFRVVP